MKYYNTAFIKSFITENKDRIETIEAGMKEDWDWTAKTLYEEGAFRKGFNWNKEHLEVAGIRGSKWATPVLQVCYKDGTKEIVCCYTDNNIATDPRIISSMIEFATLTCCMDEVTL